MEYINVPYIKNTKNILEISSSINCFDRHFLGESLWVNEQEIPVVSFTIAYSDSSIILKYFVKESSLVVSKLVDNSDVYLDSCVEFFISFNNEEAYYNFEFNSIGTCSFAFGKNRLNRSPIHEVNKVRRISSIASAIDKGLTDIHWELCTVIPLEAFIYHNISSLEDMHCKANFYKCGDALPKPHFLAWKKIYSETPDFHLPMFFGDLHFSSATTIY